MRALVFLVTLIGFAAYINAQAASTAATASFLCRPRSLEQKDKDAIVKSINDWRQKVAKGQLSPLPQAADIKAIRWDSALEASSKEWSKQCVLGNSPFARYRPDRTSPIKELVFVASKSCEAYTSLQWDKAINLWSSGATKLTTQIIDNYTYVSDRSTEVRAASLLSWASTAFVGCSYTDYEPLNGGSMYRQFIVCHFQTGGNRINYPIYQRGTVCSKCQEGYKCNATSPWPSLCDRDFNVTINITNTSTTTPPKDPNQDKTSICLADVLPAQSRAEILKLLNTERNQIALGNFSTYKSDNLKNGFPKASNMRELVWSDDLAASAHKSAGSCDAGIIALPPEKGSQLFFGQGGVEKAFTDPQWTLAAQVWFRAKNNCTDDMIKSFTNSSSTTREAKAYSQIIWANSYQIGCAYSNSHESWSSAITKLTTTQYRQYIICHFRDAANQIGQAVYGQGEAASNCGTGFAKSTTYPGLCAVKK